MLSVEQIDILLICHFGLLLCYQILSQEADFKIQLRDRA